MASTTFLRKRDDMESRELANCHDGEGALDWTSVLGKPETEGRHLRFFHDDILPPGASIGVHRHEHDEEYYFIVSGKGTMTLDGEEHVVGPGDITAVYSGGEHGLRNDGDGDLRVLVISVA